MMSDAVQFKWNPSVVTTFSENIKGTFYVSNDEDPCLYIGTGSELDPKLLNPLSPGQGAAAVVGRQGGAWSASGGFWSQSKATGINSVSLGAKNTTYGTNNFSSGHSNKTYQYDSASFGGGNTVGDKLLHDRYFEVLDICIENDNILFEGTHPTEYPDAVAALLDTTVEGVDSQSDNWKLVLTAYNQRHQMDEDFEKKQIPENQLFDEFSSTMFGYSLATGEGNYLYGKSSMSCGRGGWVFGHRSFVSGSSCEIHADDCSVGGTSCRSYCPSTFAHGRGLMVYGNSAKAALGQWNKDESARNSLLEIGNGDGSGSNPRSNAFVVFKSGYAEVDEQGLTDKSVVIKKSLDGYVAKISNPGTSKLLYGIEEVAGSNKVVTYRATNGGHTNTLVFRDSSGRTQIQCDNSNSLNAVNIGYLENTLSDYALRSEIPSDVDLSEYATKLWVQDNFLPPYALENYYTTEQTQNYVTTSLERVVYNQLQLRHFHYIHGQTYTTGIIPTDISSDAKIVSILIDSSNNGSAPSENFVYPQIVTYLEETNHTMNLYICNIEELTTSDTFSISVLYTY